MPRLYTIRLLMPDTASRRATRFSNITYSVGLLCMTLVGFYFFVVPILVLVGIVPRYLTIGVEVALVAMTVLMSFSTFVTGIVAFCLMRYVRQSAIAKKRAGRGMIMGSTALYVPLFIFCLIVGHYFSGGFL